MSGALSSSVMLSVEALDLVADVKGLAAGFRMHAYDGLGNWRIDALLLVLSRDAAFRIVDLAGTGELDTVQRFDQLLHAIGQGLVHEIMLAKSVSPPTSGTCQARGGKPRDGRVVNDMSECQVRPV